VTSNVYRRNKVEESLVDPASLSVLKVAEVDKGAKNEATQGKIDFSTISYQYFLLFLCESLGFPVATLGSHIETKGIGMLVGEKLDTARNGPPKNPQIIGFF